MSAERTAAQLARDICKYYTAPCGDERELTLYGMVSGVLRSRDALQAKLAAVELEGYA